MIRTYTPGDEQALCDLWNSAGLRMGYAPLNLEKFRKLLTEHPDFSGELSFVLEEAGDIRGFAVGCVSGTTGYISCLILDESADTTECTEKLINILEDAFRNRGMTRSAVSFFNPMRLPWVIPGTPGHQHNNVPGVAVELPLYERMLDLGYQETSRECALYYCLADHNTPDWVEEKAAKMAERGYTVARYDAARHVGLEEMLESLGNPQWVSEITAAAKAKMDLLVGLKGNVCAGFTGPVYPEETGRGYLSGIAVGPQFERNGLGTLLFYRLLQREKEVGSQYMSIFTGLDNHAKRIYLEAGFQIVRTFAVMRKEL